MVFSRLQLPRQFSKRGIFGLLFLLTLFLVSFMVKNVDKPQLLTDPFLQLPTEDSIQVVWFTEFAGKEHRVKYGLDLENTILAQTSQLSRTQEDAKSKVENRTYQKVEKRLVWRHETKITGLLSGVRLPYQVTSVREDEQQISSGIFSLAAAPKVETPLKILLTSDHQLMPMTAANLQKVEETIGRVDAVFLAGDLVNIPDRASEWFDDSRGGAFFPSLQGRAHFELEKEGSKTRYRGGEIIQHSPLFPALGNHEVMGRVSEDKDLDWQFNDPIPLKVADSFYQEKQAKINPGNDLEVKKRWLINNSFNSQTYEEIFSLPETSPGGKKYYAITFGDIRLVVPYITNIWRSYKLDSEVKGRYQERQEDLEKPELWGYGQHIFEPIKAGSEQYRWLKAELESPEFKQAKYKIVMFHHPPHTLGDNIVPAYTDPVQMIQRDETGKIQAVNYEYPIQDDYIIRDVLPLLKKAGVQLVFYGHSHLWNRFKSESGMHFLESSNVGNSYGAAWGETKRPVPPKNENYIAMGDPNGLLPIMPTSAPILNEQGTPLPYIASNEITAFSILETESGMISSYYFDTRKPDSAVVKFDEFQLEP